MQLISRGITKSFCLKHGKCAELLLHSKLTENIVSADARLLPHFRVGTSLQAQTWAWHTSLQFAKAAAEPRQFYMPEEPGRPRRCACLLDLNDIWPFSHLATSRCHGCYQQGVLPDNRCPWKLSWN